MVWSLLDTRLTAPESERDRLAQTLARAAAALPETVQRAITDDPGMAEVEPLEDKKDADEQRGWLAKGSSFLNALALFFAIVTGFWFFGEPLIDFLRSDPVEVRVLDGDLTVAVIDFAVDGEESDQPAIEELALSYSNAVAADLEERAGVPEPDAPPLGIDVLSSTEADALEGSDLTAKAGRAQTLAERHHADAVVSAEVSEDLRTVQPLVYVAPGSVPDALELSGLYAFGAPITVRAPVDENGAARSEVREALTSRSVSLAEFLMGLERHGNGQYEAAAREFERSLETWPGEEGRDLVMLFLGNASLKLDELEDARTWYEQGLRSSAAPSPRLELALLEVRFHDERGDCTGAATVQAMEELQAGYQEIQRLDAVPPGPLFDLRVEFGLARTAVCLAALNAGDYADAVQHYLAIISAYEDGNDYVRDLAGEALGGLGLIADNLGDITWSSEVCESSAECYRKAAATAVDEERQQTFTSLANA